ncbi:MAG: hypothetical protein R3300_17715 [Candidatus Promineifilaceae bacterium]|nr:hypothetical protein [Candidatus Promineifilaceae bacterium]
MQAIRSAAQEAAEDIFFGQSVVIWARWFVIATATILMLWSSSAMNQIVLAITLIVPLIAVNFFVHGRYLMEQPINRLLLIGLSLIDVAVITLIVAFWQEPTGLFSPFYVLYFPVVLAFAFIFPARTSLPYTVLATLAFAAVALLDDLSILGSSLNMERLVTRMITLAATGALGAYYWRVQRARRREAAAAEPVAG